MLPDNTVQSMDFDCVGKLSWAAVSYGAAAGNRIPILYFPAGMEEQKPAGLLAGCKTCRHKPCGVPVFGAVAHGLRRMVFHPAEWDEVECMESSLKGLQAESAEVDEKLRINCSETDIVTFRQADSS